MLADCGHWKKGNIAFVVVVVVVVVKGVYNQPVSEWALMLDVVRLISSPQKPSCCSAFGREWGSLI